MLTPSVAPSQESQKSVMSAWVTRSGPPVGGAGSVPVAEDAEWPSWPAHWVERVLPDVPVRQWVLTVPWTRRLLLARNPKLSKGVLGAALLFVALT
jgi:hypothetical protein